MSEAAAPGAKARGARIARVWSDDRLARRAVGGDERAFAAIFDRYHQPLYRYCLAIVGDPQDAQDALQNTMVKVLRALPGEERRIELKPWLYRIAHNESIELLRRRRETRQLDPELAAPGSGLAAEAASRERLRQLIGDLEQLPQRQRGVLVMRELGGLEFAEIGTALGTSAAVARQTLYEARQSLRQMDEGREMSCEAVTRALSDGDGRVARRRDLRAHLNGCADCRRFRDEIEGRERDLAALSPLPAIAAAGILQGLLGGHGAMGGLAGALGGGAAKSLGASAALKGAATVAVVATIGVGVADRGGLIDAGLPGDRGSQQSSAPQQSGNPAAAGPAAAPLGQAGSGPAAVPDRGEGADLDRSRAVSKPDPAQPGNSPPASPGPDVAPAPRGAGAAHPHGKGHAKQLPSASQHGQQTAAAHKAGNRGPAGKKSHPTRPPKPPKAFASPGSSKPPRSAAATPAPPPPPAPAAAPEAKPEKGPDASTAPPFQQPEGKSTPPGRGE